MFKLEESLRNCELRGQTRKQLFVQAFMGTWSNIHVHETKVLSSKVVEVTCLASI